MGSFSSHYNIEASFIGGLANNFVERNEGKTFIPVHSVFHRVVNLNKNGNLFSIVLPDIGRASTYIVANQDNIDFISYGIKQGINCTFCDGEVLFGNGVTVNLKKVKLWDEVIDDKFTWGLTDITKDKLSAFKSALDRYAAHGSAWRRIYDYKETKFINTVKKLSNKNSPEAILECVDKLLGFGPGLTPTGDDILLGFLSIINTCNDYGFIREDLKNKISMKLNGTTDISRSILQQAVNNRYHEYIQEVLYSLIKECPESLLIAVKRLLKIGATSGTDIATGMYLGICKL